MKIVAGLSSVALVTAGVVGYKLTHKGPPAFNRGGSFAIAGDSTTTSVTVSSTPAETTVTTAGGSSTSATTAAPTTTATTGRKGAAASSTTTATSRPRSGVTSTTRAQSGPAPTPVPTGSAAPKPPPNQPVSPVKPAVGTYTYAVDGTEGASFVGTRRYPTRMTTVVHAGAGLKPDQLVFDITYSDKHVEREIVGFRNDGIYFDFEGGSITFGPRTETSQADYEPPLLQIPLPLQPGLSRTGVSKAKNPDGTVARTEDWKATVIGQEAVTIAGASVNTWKVELQRKFRPGSADQGTRNRTFWFDPARAIWVKYVEVFHGERNTAGFGFTYDSNLTAVLESFRP